ncbi:MAG TPA: hypothetical protein VJR06_07370 [Nitrososphaerales archaeon]|nr:hypothetical protein [Nitrososphaerales archaeon]
MGEEAETVRISKKLYGEIDRRLKDGSLKFESVDAFVEFVLSETLDVRGEPMSQKDEAEVSRRLSSFGY